MTTHKFLRHSLVLLLLTLFLPSFAQIRLGYCDEELAACNDGHTSTTATISCAIRLTPQMTSEYTFTSLSHLRIGLIEPQKLSSLRIWVRQKLNGGEDLVSTSIDPATLVEGWNSLPFDSVLAIDAQRTLYVGYSYTQTERMPISGHGTNTSIGSFYIATNDAWSDYSKKYPPVSIQAELSSPYENAAILSNIGLEKRGFIIEEAEEPLCIRGSIRNYGKKSISSFSIQVQEEGEAPATYDYVCDPVETGGFVPFELKHRHSRHNDVCAPDIPVAFQVCHINGQANEHEEHITDTLYYELGRFSDKAAPLFLEEFTSEQNGYAPAGHTHLQNAIAKTGITEVIRLCRHEGYGPADGWRISGSDYTPEFFGRDRLAFVPAAWANRQEVPFSTTLSEDSIAHYIASNSRIECGDIIFDSVSIDLERRTIHAEISTHLFCLTQYEDPRLVVCLKQDSIESKLQKNYFEESYDSDYQYDVIRLFFSIPNDGQIFFGKDIQAIASGQAKAGDCAHLQFRLDDNLPNDLVSTDGLSLVAYISDRGKTYNILSAKEHVLSNK